MYDGKVPIGGFLKDMFQDESFRALVRSEASVYPKAYSLLFDEWKDGVPDTYSCSSTAGMEQLMMLALVDSIEKDLGDA